MVPKLSAVGTYGTTTRYSSLLYFFVLKSGNIPNVDVLCQLCAPFARQVRCKWPHVGLGVGSEHR